VTLQEKDTEYVVRELIEVVRMVTVEVTELQTVRARSRAFLFDTSSLGEKSASSLGEKRASSLEGAMGWSPLESPSSSDASSVVSLMDFIAIDLLLRRRQVAVFMDVAHV